MRRIRRCDGVKGFSFIYPSFLTGSAQRACAFCWDLGANSVSAVARQETQIRPRSLDRGAWNGLREQASREPSQHGSSWSAPMLYRLVKGFTEKKDWVVGRCAHALIVKCGLESDTFLANHLIRMYAAQGSLQEARLVFQQVAAPDTFVWASMIAAYVEYGQAHEGVRVYKELRGSRVRPNDYVFVAVLKACASSGDVDSGKEVHGDVMGAGMESNVFVGSALVDMYAKCSAVNEAQQVFDRISVRNVVTWSAMIAGYAQNGLAKEALQLFMDMVRSEVSPDNVTYACVLKVCGSMRDLKEGMSVHSQIVEKGLELDAVVGNSLLDMYVKCGRLDDARKIFDRCPSRDVVAWTTMIGGYGQHGLGHEALRLFWHMEEDGKTAPNNLTFATILKVCSGLGALQAGKQVHDQILKRGVESDKFVGCALVDMFAKCGSLEEARSVFDRLPIKDVITWNVIASAYLHKGLNAQALTLYTRMEQDGVEPDSATYVTVLKACSGLGENMLQEGRRIHGRILEAGIGSDVCVGNALVDMYAGSGSLLDARTVFERLLNKDVVTWNIMIGGYAKYGFAEEVLNLYARMQEAGVMSTAVTVCSILKACGTMGSLCEGRRMHAEIVDRGLDTDLFVGSALVDMFAKCGSVEESRRVFDCLPVRNVVTWNAMIAGYALNVHAQEGIELYRAMELDSLVTPEKSTFVTVLQLCGSSGAMTEGKRIHEQILKLGLETDVSVGTALIHMYGVWGNLNDARTAFNRISDKDVVVWTSIIALYAQHGLGQEALALFQSMDVAPNGVTFACILKVCASMGAIGEGKRIHIQLFKTGCEADISVGNTLVDMYAKCGRLEEAQEVFDRLSCRNVVTWTALINGYGQHNDCERAIECFQAMQAEGVEPNEATLTALLVACGHVAWVEEGQHYFTMMEELFGIVPTLEHYTCMVDLLGRAGCLDDAERLLELMPWEPDVVGWMSLLNACKCYGNVERGRTYFNRIVQLEPHQAGAYVLMSSMYAGAGRWRDAEEIEKLRRSAGACKMPARALIEVDNKVHEFLVGEKSDDISLRLKTLITQLKGEGHLPASNLVLKRISATQKEDTLCGHAEKLAIAFGLLHTPRGTPLLVTKNLKMCNDCHSVSKILSKLEQREIVVRDAHRVHHFKGGTCSCGDHH